MMKTRSDERNVVPISDGTRPGLVWWDSERASYRAEIELFPEPTGSERPVELSSDTWWDWVSDPRPGVLPGRVVIGCRMADLPTIDSLTNRLASIGYRLDRYSHRSLLKFRGIVSERYGSVVFIGRLPPCATASSTAVGELVLGLPDGRALPIQPRIEHPDHGFGWGRHGEAVVRTAAVMVELAWSAGNDAATDAAAVDLAVTVLSGVRGGFVWRAESVADWIAAEIGELSDVARGSASASAPAVEPLPRQLALEIY